VHEKALLHAAVPFLFIAHQSPGTPILVYLCVCPRALVACVRACLPAYMNLHVCMCIHARERERERERCLCSQTLQVVHTQFWDLRFSALQKKHSAHAQYMNFAEYMNPTLKTNMYSNVRACVRVCVWGGGYAEHAHLYLFLANVTHCQLMPLLFRPQVLNPT